MGRGTIARWVFAAGLVGGIGYMLSWNLGLSHSVETAWKGSGVGLLALYAALRARTLDGWLVAVVMALGAAGDVLLETSGLIVGALAFLAGHVVAIGLYLRNRRARRTGVDFMVGAMVVAATVALAWSLPTDRASAPGIALYSTGLSAMAACAWLSRFPRPWVATGALMFLISDLLIFARLGPLGGLPWVGFGVWILYFGGQVLICLGVTRTLGQKT